MSHRPMIHQPTTTIITTAPKKAIFSHQLNFKAIYNSPKTNT
jgi:hypothetical protein